MQAIPDDIQGRYLLVLEKRAVPVSRHADYKKWLRYFFDFREKYPLPDSRSDQVRMFIQKLRDKRQTTEQQKQAAHAISLYFELQPRMKSAPAMKKGEHSARGDQPIRLATLSAIEANCKASSDTVCSEDTGSIKELPSYQEEGDKKKWGARYNDWRCLKKSSSPDWDKLIDALAAEIRTRHYSRKTLKTYADWIRKFQHYLRNKQPDTLSATDVKAYLTFLAVNCKVAASTQNRHSTRYCFFTSIY